MRNQTTANLWFRRVLFAVLCLFAIMIAKIPLGLPADASLTPDFLFALIMVWVIRAPGAATMPLIFAVALYADFVMNRPPGLGAFCTVLASEYFRTQRFTLREQMFVVEWLFFAVILAVCHLLQSFILALSFAEVPPFELIFGYMMLTIAIYPLVTLIVRYVFRIASPQNEVETLVNGRY